MKLGQSIECSKSELDVFSVPPTQTSIEEGFYDDIPAHPSFTNSNMIRFDILGDSAHYLNLSETEIHVVGHICKVTDPLAGIGAAVKVGPANNFLHSLISKANIKINNLPVEMGNDSYQLRSYLENLLSYNNIEKKCVLEGDVFAKDAANLFNTVTVDAATANNSGFMARRKKFLDKKSVQLQGRLHCDLFNLDHFMVNSVGITLELTKSKPEFYLIGDSTDAYHFVFEECFLRIRRQVISPSVMAAHALTAEHATYKYPVKRVVLKPFVIPHASTKCVVSAICIGVMPRRVICGFLETKAYDGDIKKNPYEFKNFELESLILKVNSKSLPISNGLKFDFAHDRYLDGYRSLTKIIKDLDITYEEYKNGYTLFAFDLNPDISSCEHFSLLKDGSLDLELTKTAATVDSITLICYLEYDNIIEINKYRVPSFDYVI